jgi:hypothetical protein
MMIQRRWGFLAQMLSALVISVVLLTGCGGSTQSASTGSDASSSVVAVTPPTQHGHGQHRCLHPRGLYAGGLYVKL